MILPAWQQFALETLGWTALLIALVLLARRPVARLFGPQIAYGLWLLPMARLFLPPLTLPSWMAPSPRASEAVAPELTQTRLATIDAEASITALAPAAQGTVSTGATIQDLAISALVAGPIVEIALVVWLIGAAVFLYRRFAAYFELRETLLSDSREVGRSGRIRLVETTGTKAPLAFGVIDPVIALPPGFMAQPDRRARDLALAHELAHHRAHDLAVNVAVQPLFAMHWWNLLGRYGWLALRRDQEAACDARVLAREPAEARVAYAHLIANTATAPRAALAAPMACPVLGDKSIIQRLRNLNMTDTPANRRLAGRLMVGAALLALPLTATITYAAGNPAEAPEAKATSVAAAPAIAPLALQAATQSDAERTIVKEIETEIEEDVTADADGENTVVIRKVIKDEDGKERVEVRKRKFVHPDGHTMSKEEMEAHMEKMRAEMADMKHDMKDIDKKVAHAMKLAFDHGEHGRTVVKSECRGGPDDIAKVETDEDGARTVYMCQARVMAKALEGLKQARKAIADNPEIKAQMRAEILKELDSEIADWNKNKSDS